MFIIDDIIAAIAAASAAAAPAAATGAAAAGTAGAAGATAAGLGAAGTAASTLTVPLTAVGGAGAAGAGTAAGLGAGGVGLAGELGIGSGFGGFGAATAPAALAGGGTAGVSSSTGPFAGALSAGSTGSTLMGGNPSASTEVGARGSAPNITTGDRGRGSLIKQIKEGAQGLQPFAPFIKMGLGAMGGGQGSVNYGTQNFPGIMPAQRPQAAPIRIGNQNPLEPQYNMAPYSPGMGAPVITPYMDRRQAQTIRF